MTISLYDTASRRMREFVQLRPGQVSIYLCGATVQAPPHIGHIRGGGVFDVMSRWLAHRGYEVTRCATSPTSTTSCDALLSAAGLGGLGPVFGTDRPEWAGASPPGVP